MGIRSARRDDRADGARQPVALRLRQLVDIARGKDRGEDGEQRDSGQRDRDEGQGQPHADRRDVAGLTHPG
jgi:hypothetical protein